MSALQDHPWPLVQWGVVLGTALLAALLDLRSRRIPNTLTLPVMALGPLQAGIVAGFRGVAESLAGCALAALPFVLLFLYARGGAGDAKLMGALGAWLGLLHSLVLLAAVSVAGIVFGLLYARRHGRLRDTLGRTVHVLGGAAAPVRDERTASNAFQSTSLPLESDLRMPYGVAIFLGALLATGSALL